MNARTRYIVTRTVKGFHLGASYVQHETAEMVGSGWMDGLELVETRGSRWAVRDGKLHEINGARVLRPVGMNRNAKFEEVQR